MADLKTLGLGKTMEKKLRSVGIATAEQLRETGSREAVLRLKARYPGTSGGWPWGNWTRRSRGS